MLLRVLPLHLSWLWEGGGLKRGWVKPIVVKRVRPSFVSKNTRLRKNNRLSTRLRYFFKNTMNEYFFFSFLPIMFCQMFSFCNNPLFLPLHYCSFENFSHKRYSESDTKNELIFKS
jgi:hypothetical protein